MYVYINSIIETLINGTHPSLSLNITNKHLRTKQPSERHKHRSQKSHYTVTPTTLVTTPVEKYRISMGLGNSARARVLSFSLERGHEPPARRYRAVARNFNISALRD